MKTESSSRPLPAGWKLIIVDDIAAVIRNGATGRQNKDGLGFPVSRIETISDGIVNREKVGYLSTVDAEKIERYRLIEGDILFSNINSDFHLGKTALVRSELPTLYHGMNLLLVRVDSREILPLYLHYLFYLYRFSGYFISIAQHAVNQSSINQTKLRKVPIPLAPYSEQEIIVSEIEKQFTRLDQAVASLKRAQANLERYKASVLKAACEGRLVPQDPDDEPAELLLQRILTERRRQWEEQEWQKLVEKAQKKVAQARRKADGRPARLSDIEPEDWQAIPEAEYTRYLPKNDKWKEKYKEPEGVETAEMPSLPDGWVWASVEQLNPGDRSCAYGVLQPGQNVADGTRLVRVGDIQEGQIFIDNMKRISPEIADKYKRTKLSGGEVLISLVGAIGRTAVVPTSLAGANTARAVGVIPLINLVFSPWVEIWFRNPQKIQEMTSKAHEVARKTLNLEDVRTADVALPPREEQDRILDEVERRLSVIAANEKAIAADLARAERLRQSILQQAFSGQLVSQV